MPIVTDLDVAPWYDDYTANADYYGVLFQPAYNVQTRELNTLQSILRNQVEKFGDAIFQTGTIISGCNFNFLPNYCYAKLNDVGPGGLQTVASDYVGFFVTNQANLTAFVVGSRTGFQATAPNLMTIYLSYQNSGNNNNTFAFSPGDVLTVYDSNDAIWSVNINASGIGFSNTNQVIFTPALVVNVTAGSFSVGQYVSQPTTGANLQIKAIDSTTLANVGQIVLTLTPRTADLASATLNVAAWAVANNDAVFNVGNTGVGTVEALIGSGASATLQTDGAGRITDVVMTSGGIGYVSPWPPTVSVYSPNNSTGLGTYSLAAENYFATVQVASAAGSVGNGYAFAVGDGIIYMRGLFLLVNAQTIIIDPYDTTPNAISVGFTAVETIVDSNIDPSLLDNSTGTRNAMAPGADRLKIVPLLVTQTQNAIGNSSYLPLVQWSEGNPFLQNQFTQYSQIGDQIARGISDTAGNFSIAQFSVTSRSPFASAYEGNTFSIVVSPGTAYINGHKIQTTRNDVIDDGKGTFIYPVNNFAQALSYDYWLEIENIGGVFPFSVGANVGLYNAATGFLANTAAIAAGNAAPAGTLIGTARVRSLTYLGGSEAGTSGALYKLYLFDVNMNTAQNFANVKTVAYTGGPWPGVADVVQTANVTRFANSVYSSLIFPTGYITIQNVNAVNFIYRAMDQTVTMANNGILTKSVASDPSASFPTYLETNLQDIYLVPLSNNLIFTTNVAGTVSVNTTSNNMVGTSTSFVGVFQPGDYVYIYSNSTVNTIKQVETVVNNTLIYLDSDPSFTLSGLGAYQVFPENVPIPLIRSGLGANISANGNLLTVNLGNTFQFSGLTNCAIGVDILRSNASPGVKHPNRNQMVLIDTANNSAGANGPWCLGVPDVFRLKHVYIGNSSVNTSSPEYTASFYIESGQNDSWLDLSFLHLNPTSGLSINNSSYLLCVFDYFTTTGIGYYTATSYLSSNLAQQTATDSTPVINLTTSILSWEVPEVYATSGYYDLLNCFDFRPIAANTTAPGSNTSTAPINPTYALSFGNVITEFPLPDSIMNASMNVFLGRIDTVIAGQDSNIVVISGVPSLAPLPPNIPTSAMLLNSVIIPPYPDMPANPSPVAAEMVTNYMACAGIQLGQRSINHTIVVPTNLWQVENQQPQGYTMEQIGALDRRISDLEYYVSLSAMETDMVSTVVPSSVDPSTNRFQYGIFVDNFTSLVSQDTSDPAYAASVAGNTLNPRQFAWPVSFGVGGITSQPYVDFPIINQTVATGLGPNTTIPGITEYTWILATDYDVLTTSTRAVFEGSGEDFITFTATANTGYNISFYFNVPPTTVFGEYDPCEFLIYQSTTPAGVFNKASHPVADNSYDSYNDAVALTGSDISFLKSNSVPANWWVASSSDGVTVGLNNLRQPLHKTLGTEGSLLFIGGVSGAGKITFTHNPQNGIYYAIESVKATDFDHWKWSLQYPADFQPPNPTGGTANNLSSVFTPLQYSGFMNVSPSIFTLELRPVPVPASQVNTAMVASLAATFNQNYAIRFDGTSISRAARLAAPGTQIISSITQLQNVLSSLGSSTGSLITTPLDTSLEDQGFEINCWGLKPNTIHSFYVQGINKTSECKPLGGTVGQPLITDASGVMIFTYFYRGSTVDQDVTATLLSNTVPIQQTYIEQAGMEQISRISDGNVIFTLSAPNSTATISMQVGADPGIPLNDLTNPGVS